MAAIRQSAGRAVVAAPVPGAIDFRSLEKSFHGQRIVQSIEFEQALAKNLAGWNVQHSLKRLL